MRRKDRALSRAAANRIIDDALYGSIGLLDGAGLPYTVPLSLAREGDTLYFHSAKSGKKTALLADGTAVSVLFVGQASIPDRLSTSELEALAADPGRHHVFGEQVFTCAYESVMVTGVVRCLEDEAARIHGLEVICQKFTPEHMAYLPHALRVDLKYTAVYAIDMQEITAKGLSM